MLGAYVAFRDQLPARIPVHWGTHGADRFVSPERGMVEGGVIALAIWLSMALVCSVEGQDKASAAVRIFLQPLRGLMPTCLLVFMTCILGKPLLGDAAFGVGIGIFLLGTLAAIIIGLVQLPEGALSADPEDLSQKRPDCWKWGLFYINPEDERLWVPKKYGGGWTFNFAHRRAKVYMVLTVALPLAALLAVALLK